MQKLIPLLLVIFVINVFNCNLQASPFDSNSKIKVEKDTVSINAALEKGKALVGSRPDSALCYLKPAALAAKNINFDKGYYTAGLAAFDSYRVKGDFDSAKTIVKYLLSDVADEWKARTYIALGVLYSQTGEYDSALTVFNSEPLQNIKEGKDKGSLYNNMANVFSSKGENARAVEYYLKAAEIQSRLGNKAQLAYVYNNIGTEQKIIGEYQKSIDYYKKAAVINKEVSNLSQLGANYLNMGVSYKALGEQDSALAYYSKSLSLAEQVGDVRLAVQSYMNMAILRKLRNEYKISEDLYKKCKALCIKHHIQYGVMLSYANLGSLYNDMENFRKAESALDTALSYANKLGTPKEKMQIYNMLVDTYSEKKNYEKAFNYQKLSQAIKDSLFNEETHKQIEELQIKYESAEKENEIMGLKNKSLKQEQLIFILLISAFFLAALVIFFWNRRKVALVAKELEREKALHLEKEVALKEKELIEAALRIGWLQDNFENENVSVLGNVKDIPEEELDLSNESPEKWTDFDEKFRKVHDEFYNKVIATYPDLTPAELRVVMLLRLQLTSKEIGDITNRSVRTIEYTRNNIRKKMNLSGKDNLVTHILAV